MTRLAFQTLLLCTLLQAALGTFVHYANSKHQYEAFTEKYANFPTFHTYFNRHFGKSRQFNDFLEVLEDVNVRAQDYALLLLTDCDKANDELEPCQVIRANNDNRAHFGMKPHDRFLSLGNKKMQRNPTIVTYNHPKDVYTPDEILDFIDTIVPSFVDTVDTLEDLEDFMKPRYSPKLFYLTKQDTPPTNINKLSVHFFEHIDFAFIEDLSEDLIEHFQIQNFPTILLLTFNYDQNEFERHIYTGPQFDKKGYYAIKEFLAKFALKQPRNDFLFHQIKQPRNTEIHTVDNQIDLWRYLDRAPSWVMIEEGPKLNRLPKIKQKYGHYFSYVHFSKPQINKRIKTYIPRDNETVYLAEHQSETQNEDDGLSMQMVKHNAQDLLSNATTIAAENYTVLLVKQQYGHLCSLSEHTLFRGIMFCFVIGQEYEKDVSDRFNGQQFSVGAICQSNGSQNLQCSKLEESEFQKVYPRVEYVSRFVMKAVKLKLQQVMRNFVEDPIRKLDSSVSIGYLCRDPAKKCAIAFLDTSKAEQQRVELGFLKTAAQNFFTEFKIFWVENKCNKQFKENVGEPRMTMMAYLPDKQTFAMMRNRLSSSLVSKFLKEAHRGQLNFKKLPNVYEKLNDCLGQESEKQL